MYQTDTLYYTVNSLYNRNWKQLQNMDVHHVHVRTYACILEMSGRTYKWQQGHKKFLLDSIYLHILRVSELHCCSSHVYFMIPG